MRNRLTAFAGAVQCIVRLPILPLAVAWEVCLLVAVVVLAQLNTKRAADIITLAERLPDIGWYFGKQSNAERKTREAV
jgi:hypothetical protein